MSATKQHIEQKRKPTELSLTQELLKIRFYAKGEGNSILNLSESKYRNLKIFGDEWNKSLRNTCVDKMTSARRMTAEVLVYIMAERMEKLRKTKPMKYLMYLSDEFEAIPFNVSRADIVNVLGGGISTKTAYNHVESLRKMVIQVTTEDGFDELKFITEKHATSSITINGEYMRAANGRGKMQLWISKKMLSFNFNVPQFLQAENARLECNQKKNLLHLKLKETPYTRKSIDNNQQGLKGVAKPPQEIKATLCVDEKAEKLTDEVATADNKKIVPAGNLQIDDSFTASPQ